MCKKTYEREAVKLRSFARQLEERIPKEKHDIGMRIIGIGLSIVEYEHVELCSLKRFKRELEEKSKLTKVDAGSGQGLQ